MVTKSADAGKLETGIDQRVYVLYGVMIEESAVVEQNSST